MADSLHPCPRSMLRHSSAALPGTLSVSGQTIEEQPFLWIVAIGHVRSYSLAVECALSEFLLPSANFALVITAHSPHPHLAQ